jgi:phosphatidylinositol alpha-mannosyltransferase
MKKLVIGLVFDDSLDRTDGVQQYVKLLGRQYSKMGHEVHYLVGQSDPKLNPDLNIHSLAKNVNVKANQNRLSIPLPSSPSAINKVLESINFDVIHVMVPYSPFMSSKVINRIGPEIKLVGTFHIIGASALEKIGTKALSLALTNTRRKFDKFIAVSPAARDYAQQYFGITAEVIPNAVNVENFLSGKPLEKYKDTQNIVYINRLVERKGCGYLIDAVGVLNEQGKFNNRKLIVCGKGPLKEKLENKVRTLGLEERVEFVGFISEEEKPNYLASAGLACFPSTGGEAFGIVLIEAMAAGALTLGGDNAGYASVLGDKDKLLINPKQTTSFAERIDLLLDNQILRDELLKWQENTIKQYDVAVVASRLLEIYSA